jgi:hypothetical protein
MALGEASEHKPVANPTIFGTIFLLASAACVGRLLEMSAYGGTDVRTPSTCVLAVGFLVVAIAQLVVAARNAAWNRNKSQ